MNIVDGGLGLKIAGYDKEGPMFATNDVVKCLAAMINTNELFERKAKMMTPDIQRAETHLEDAIVRFKKQYSELQRTEASFVTDAKKVVGNVKDAEEKLLQGLARVEKAANFERLSRYVELLERAATAMNQLAELEKEGRLDKIASAIR
jgi:hypothetical protein